MSLNPDAKAFVFNAGASSFNPTFAAPAKPLEVAPAPTISIAAAAPAVVPAPVVAKEPTPVETVSVPVVLKKPAPVETTWEDEDVVAKESTPKETPKVKRSNKSSKSPKAASTPVESPKQRSCDSASLNFHDPRPHLNIVFIGHVDAGKSTISGQMMLLTGQVDERTLAKYEREAKEKNRESWYLAFVMDTNEEERAKGKTVEVGRAHFTTEKKRFTLLDAPGHKNYVPNMIGGTAQADIGVLVISARKGEFEAGFARGGQTREHAMLAKTLGIQRLIVMINKMDEKTVKWSKERYDNIQKRLNPFLKKWGYRPKREVIYVPVSGYTGHNLKELVPKKICPWYEGHSFMSILDGLPALNRNPNAPLRMPIIAKYREMGATCCLGKIESGSMAVGDTLLMNPNNIPVQCVGLVIEDESVEAARCGENVVVQIKGIEEDDIHEGFVLSHEHDPTPRTVCFAAQIVVTDLLEHKPLITAGYDCILHVHTAIQECQIAGIISVVDKKTGNEIRRPRYINNGAVAKVKITLEESVAVEEFQSNNQMGRFTLRDEGKTVAVGKILKLRPVDGEQGK